MLKTKDRTTSFPFQSDSLLIPLPAPAQSRARGGASVAPHRSGEPPLGMYADLPADGSNQLLGSSFQAVNPVSGEIFDFNRDSITGNIESPQFVDGLRRSARSERYRLQRVASTLLLDSSDLALIRTGHGSEVKTHRTCSCHRTAHGEIGIKKFQGSAFYTGLSTCGNVFSCPICAGKVGQRRGTELRAAFEGAKSLGLHVSMLTFTVPHYAGDKMLTVSRALRDALEAFWSEFTIKNTNEKKGNMGWKHRFRVVGNVRSLEVRFGSNGPHPHFHLLVFSEVPIPSSEQEFLLSVWKRVCLRVGLSEPNSHGVDVQDGSKAGEYINKLGSDDEFVRTGDGQQVTWDAADEMTKGHTKKGRFSLGAFDLLRVCARDPEAIELGERVFSRSGQSLYRHCRFLFRDYVHALKGASQIKFSRGLRKLLGVCPEKTDEELASETQEEATDFCIISTDEWRVIMRSMNRTKPLDFAESGTPENISQFIAGLSGGVTRDLSRSGSRIETETASVLPSQVEISLCVLDSDRMRRSLSRI